jgi:ABC-type sulfate transport system permease component
LRIFIFFIPNLLRTPKRLGNFSFLNKKSVIYSMNCTTHNCLLAFLNFVVGSAAQYLCNRSTLQNSLHPLMEIFAALPAPLSIAALLTLVGCAKENSTPSASASWCWLPHPLMPRDQWGIDAGLY